MVGHHFWRTLRIALIVGTILFVINQLDVVLRGQATAAVWIKGGVTYLVPFIVSNIGGSLTPLGDPPLFLGFLQGVDFFWTVSHILPETLFLVGVLLAVFYAMDRRHYRREGVRPRDLPEYACEEGIFATW